MAGHGRNRGKGSSVAVVLGEEIGVVWERVEMGDRGEMERRHERLIACSHGEVKARH